MNVQADDGGNPVVAVETSKNTKTGLEQNELLDKLQELGIGKKKAEDLINKFDAARIKELINLVISDHKIKKKAGFVIKALEDGYLLPDLDAQPKEDYLKIKTEKYLRELKEAEKNADFGGLTRLLQMLKSGNSCSSD